MTNIATDLETRRKLATLGFAYKAFSLAEAGFEEIVNRNADDLNELTKALILCGAVVNYGKPFKRGNALDIIPDTMIPDEYSEAHSVLITVRDKIFAHTDAEGLKVEDGELNQLEYVVKDHVASLQFIDHKLNMDLAGDFLKLSQFMREKTGDELHRVQNGLLGVVSVPDGVYRLSLDKSEDVLMPIKSENI